MLKYSLTIVLTIGLFAVAIAQEKSWLDNDRNVVNDSTTAVFYQIKEADASIGLIKEETYYKQNDQLFSKGYLEIRTDYRTGTWQWFYSNGNKMRQLTYSSDRIVGYQSIYNSDGTLLENYALNKSSEEAIPYNYKYKKELDGSVSIKDGNGVFNGPYKGDSKAIDSLSGHYNNQKASGLWKAYKDNVLVYEEMYEDGIPQSGKSYRNGKSYTYDSYSQSAQPLMNSKKFGRKLQIHISHYYDLIELNKNDYSTNMSIVFMINTEGNVSDIKIMNGMGKGPDEMAIRGLRSMDVKWKPAQVRGIPVPSYVRIPFSMESRECSDC